MMQPVLKQRTSRWLGGLGLLTTSLALVGCTHMAYVDPNPSTPYAFPDTAPKGSNLAASAPLPGTPPPVPVAPVATLAQPPVVPVTSGTTPLEPVSIPQAAPQSPSIMDAPGVGSSTLRVGDGVSVSLSDIPVIPPEIKTTITEEGRLTALPFGVSVQAAGKTPSQIQEAIEKALVPKYYVRVTVNVKADDRVFFVGGEVKTPTRLAYRGDMTVLRAIDTAGGFTDFASRKYIELRRANKRDKYLIDWNKAIKDPKLDLPVYADDQVLVHKRKPLGF
jgi:protein involved in polysaccharide export with SLBB domain